MIEIALEVNRDLTTSLVRAQAAVRDLRTGSRMSTFLAEIAEFESKQNVATFDTQGAKSGKRWTSLSPGYARWKKEVRPGRKILQFDGDLRRSLVQRGRDRIARLRGAVIELGTKERKAVKHQRGEPRKNLPARPVVRKSKEQARQLAIQYSISLFKLLGSVTRGAIKRSFDVAAGKRRARWDR